MFHLKAVFQQLLCKALTPEQQIKSIFINGGGIRVKVDLSPFFIALLYQLKLHR